MIGLQGDKMEVSAVKTLAEVKIKKLNTLYRELSKHPKCPPDLRPTARIYEVEWAKRVFELIAKGKEDKAKPMLLALPTAIGKVNLYSKEFVVHLGWGHFAYKVGENVLPVMGVRGKYAAEGVWVEIRDMVKNSTIPKGTPNALQWLLDHDYTTKTQHVGMITCPGWTELQVSFNNPDDYRTFKDLKLGEHYKCGKVVCVSELYHQTTCPDCTAAKARARGVGYRTKTTTESVLNNFLKTLMEEE
jgi:hypothetical protein